jgi:signal transduction histidine kinase
VGSQGGELELAARYHSAVEGYLAGGGAAALRDAYELGSEALDAGIGPSVLLSIHRGVTDPALRDVAQELETSTRDAVLCLQQLLEGLRLSAFDRSGLASAIRVSLERLESEFAIGWDLVDTLEREPSVEAGTASFQIIKEALANMRKHACASQVRVSLESRSAGCLARVTDDGVGFDVETATQQLEPGHLGISAMRERARLAGGWLSIRSAPGETSVQFWIPDIAAPQ